MDTGAEEAKVAENGRVISCHMLAPRTPLPCVHTACGRSTCLCGVSAESDWVTIAEAHRDQAAGTTSSLCMIRQYAGLSFSGACILWFILLCLDHVIAALLRGPNALVGLATTRLTPSVDAA